jgi:hypothetical protein
MVRYYRTVEGLILFQTFPFPFPNQDSAFHSKPFSISKLFGNAGKWKWKINVDVPVLGATCICGTVKCAANHMRAHVLLPGTGDFTQFVRGQMSCAHSVRFSKRLEISIPNGPFPFQTGRFHSKLRMRLEWKRIDRNSLIISRFSKPLF